MRTRLPPLLAALLALASPALAAEAPAASGRIALSRPGPASYGPDPAFTCKSGGVTASLGTDLGKAAKGKDLAADGRLCAIAEALLGWDHPEQPPESVRTALSWHFGLPTTFQRALTATIETEDWRVIGERFAAAAAPFVTSAAHPRYGVATRRLERELTRVALVLLDEGVALEPVPRQVAAGGQVALRGRLPRGAASPRVYACDAAGGFSAPAQEGDAVKAELACGDQPGRLLVDVRAEVNGATQTLARLAVDCGEPRPAVAALEVAPLRKGPVDAAAAARRLFELGNAERVAAGLPELAWSDEVAGAARAAAEGYRDEAGGKGGRFDVEAALKSAEVSTLLVLQNPVAALSVEEAATVTAQSPVNRCNLLNREVTTAGVGVASSIDEAGNTIVFATALLVRELPALDAPALREKLRGAIAARREAARAAPLSQHPLLEEVAQRYADLLATSRGAPGKAEEAAVVKPLYEAFLSVSIMSGAKAAPLELAEEPGMIGAGRAMGVGAAGGAHPVLGKNAPYAVVILGTPREPREKRATPVAPSNALPRKVKK